MIKKYCVYKSSPDIRVEFLKADVSDHFFPVHHHKSICIGRIDQGSIKFNFGNNEVIYNQNDFYIIPPLKSHSCSVSKDQITSYSTMSFSDRNELETLILDQKICTELQIRGLLPLLQFGYTQSLPQNFSAEIAQRLSSFITERPLNVIRLDLLSEFINISQSRLQHVFKSQTGMCLKDFIMQEKIRKAKSMLLNKDLIDIVYECGFYDQSHFSRNFKKITGLPPLRYAESISFF